MVLAKSLTETDEPCAPALTAAQLRERGEDFGLEQRAFACGAELARLVPTLSGPLQRFFARAATFGQADRVGFSPSVEATAQDIGTVLDAACSRRVVLFGASEGGPACIRFAADHPDRVAGLVLFAALAKGSSAPDYPHALHAEQHTAWLQQMVSAWGGPAGIETFAPSLKGDAKARTCKPCLTASGSSSPTLPGNAVTVAYYAPCAGIRRLAAIFAGQAASGRSSKLILD